VNTDLRARLDKEYADCKSRIKHPSDLLGRILSDDDFADSAVIGGVSISDVLNGRVHEGQIPSTVKHAFELQYPNLHEGFVHAVQRLANEPDSLRGLVNGVRGKLFELDYVDYLNHGHLPVGYVASLAHSATNPAWDIQIDDHHGHVSEVLQLKASAGLEAAKHALAVHPSVDVVIPHDVLEHFSNQADEIGHLVDGHETLGHLNDTMNIGVHHAELAVGSFHVPYVTFGWIVLTSFQQYRTGRLSLQGALENLRRRTVTSAFAIAAGWFAQAILHKTIVGIPVAIWARWRLGRWFKAKDMRKVLDQRIIIISETRSYLENNLNRQTLALPSPSIF
jgi:hypothetical protein